MADKILIWGIILIMASFRHLSQRYIFFSWFIILASGCLQTQEGRSDDFVTKPFNGFVITTFVIFRITLLYFLPVIYLYKSAIY